MTRRARGFTLIEVTLAILLFALLLAGSYGAIRTATRSIQSGESAIDRMNRLRVAQEFLRHQISRTLPLPFGRDEHTNANFVFEGSRDAIRFVAPMPGYLSNGGPYVQTLAFKGSRGSGRALMFTDEMLNGFDLAEAKSGRDAEPVLLLDQIEEGHFEFRGVDENGELADWTDRWEDPGITPLMVRIVARMQPQARVEFPVMDIPLMLDASARRNVMSSQFRSPGTLRGATINGTSR